MYNRPDQTFLENWDYRPTPRGTLGRKMSAYQFSLNSYNIWPPLRSSKGPQEWLELALSEGSYSLRGVAERWWISIKIGMQLPLDPKSSMEFFPVFQTNIGLA